MVAGNYYLVFESYGLLSIMQRRYNTFVKAFQDGLKSPGPPDCQTKVVVEVTTLQKFPCLTALTAILVDASVRQGVALEQALDLTQIRCVLQQGLRIVDELQEEVSERLSQSA